MKVEAFESKASHYQNDKFVGGILQADTVKECLANSSLTTMCVQQWFVENVITFEESLHCSKEITISPLSLATLLQGQTLNEVLRSQASHLILLVIHLIALSIM